MSIDVNVTDETRMGHWDERCHIDSPGGTHTRTDTRQQQ